MGNPNVLDKVGSDLTRASKRFQQEITVKRVESTGDTSFEQQDAIVTYNATSQSLEGTFGGDPIDINEPNEVSIKLPVENRIADLDTTGESQTADEIIISADEDSSGTTYEVVEVVEKQFFQEISCRLQN